MPTRGAWLLLTACAFAAAAAADDLAQVTHLTDANGDRQPLHTVVPLYPERARRERIEGEVEVCFNVDRSGRTSRVRVRRSTHRMFEKPSVRAVRASTYKALPADQRLSGIKTCRTFIYQLIPVAIEQP